jgi:site-specific recombinase XerD
VCAQIQQPLARALVLLRRRGGVRVSAMAQLQGRELDWSQPALLLDHGKGRQDRRVDRSAEAVASVHACLQQRPSEVPGAMVFWHQKRPSRPLSVQAIPKTLPREAHAAGLPASGHRLRPTCASDLLDQGAALVSLREGRGPASLSSSER